MRSNIFDRLSFLSLFLVIILLPFFFLPFTNLPVMTSKGTLLVFGLVCSLIFWGFARFFDGKIILPRSMFLAGGGAIVLVVFLSAVFVKASQVSFFGTMFDTGSFWFIFASFLLMLLCSIVFRDPKSARIVLFGAILSSVILFVIQIIRLLMPEAETLGVLAGKTDNLLGSWNELGIFAGFAALMSLLVVEFFSTTRVEKLILQILVILSLFLVAAVNFSFVWGLFGVFALIIFVYKISISSSARVEETSPDEEDSRSDAKSAPFPVFSFIVILIALFFFISRGFVGGFLPERFGISNNEIGPSLASTMTVTKSVLKNNLLLGIGPNKFGEAWAMYKPLAINGTNFWNVPFNSGSGLLPTFIATTGYLGILAWLVFFILFLIAGARSIFSSIKNGVNWETMAFFSLSLYLFISSFFYPTGPVIFLLALAFAGVFAGLSASNSKNGEIAFSFLNDHRKSFFSMMFIVLIIILSVAIAFKYVERLASVSYFRKALTAETVEVAEASINKALALHQNDLYFRAYGEVHLVKLNSLIAKGESLEEADKALLQPSLDQAINGVLGAISYNPKNYLNFQALGSLYQGLAAFGVSDANAKAIEAYSQASLLNPGNPRLKLSMAVLSLADKKYAAAKEYGNAAILLMPNYIDAHIVLSQVARSEGDSALALKYAETALSIAPGSEDLKKYVEALKKPSSSSVVPPATSTSSDSALKPPKNPN